MPTHLFSIRLPLHLSISFSLLCLLLFTFLNLNITPFDLFIMIPLFIITFHPLIFFPTSEPPIAATPPPNTLHQQTIFEHVQLALDNQNLLQVDLVLLVDEMLGIKFDYLLLLDD